MSVIYLELMFSILKNLVPILVGILLISHRQIVSYIGELLHGPKEYQSFQTKNNLIPTLLTIVGGVMIFVNLFDILQLFRDFSRLFGR